MKSPLFTALALLTFVFSLSAAEFGSLSVSSPEGQELKARLLKPEGQGGKVPLVIILHGAGERGTDNEAQLKHGAPLFQKENAKYPCYVLAPQCPPNQKWVDADWTKPITPQPAEMTWPTKLLVQMIDQLVASSPDLDANRIYLTGLSMGGFGTWDLITRFPEKFAAAVPVCGGGDFTKVAPLAQLPIWTFHGDKDSTIPIVQTRNLVAALEKAGGQPLYSELSNRAHDAWKTAYAEPELLPWLFAQRRGLVPVPFAKVASPYSQPPSHTFPSTGPVQEGIWFRTLWHDKRQQWAKDLAKDMGAIVFLGDSITQGWETLAQDFAGYKVANRGISGDTTRGVLYRLKEDVLEVHPRAVSMLIGTNDLGLGGTPEVAAQNFKLILAELHKANPKMPVIVNLVMPSTAAKSRPSAKLQALNNLLKKATQDDPTVTIVDTYSLFANESGDAKLEEFPDLLHPNAAGYAKWREVLLTTFTKLGLGSAPTAATPLLLEDGRLVLDLRANGIVHVGSEPLEALKIRDHLQKSAASSPDLAVIIRTPQDLKGTEVAALLDLCVEAKLWNVALQAVPAQ